mmetsp:Transcript_21747/g.55770  ORF Transcript_21747/g.55770 Transcript_21747/m.55770 type:complete len:240 (-) Transcript_21747:553-1272(-)
MTAPTPPGPAAASAAPSRRSGASFLGCGGQRWSCLAETVARGWLGCWRWGFWGWRAWRLRRTDTPRCARDDCTSVHCSSRASATSTIALAASSSSSVASMSASASVSDRTLTGEGTGSATFSPALRGRPSASAGREEAEEEAEEREPPSLPSSAGLSSSLEESARGGERAANRGFPLTLREEDFSAAGWPTASPMNCIRSFTGRWPLLAIDFSLARVARPCRCTSAPRSAACCAALWSK